MTEYQRYVQWCTKNGWPIATPEQFAELAGQEPYDQHEANMGMPI